MRTPTGVLQGDSGCRVCRAAFASALLVVGLACGALAQDLTEEPELPAEPEVMPEVMPEVVPEVMEESPGRVEIVGVSETRFNARVGTLFFRVSDTRLSATINDILVLVNSERVPDETLAVAPNMIAVSYVLAPGLNELSLVAYDAERRLLSADAMVWAGAHVLTVDVVDEDLNPLSGVEVTASLTNARAVQATAVTVDGTVRFENLPDENVALEATHPDGDRVRATARRGVGSILLRFPR